MNAIVSNIPWWTGRNLLDFSWSDLQYLVAASQSQCRQQASRRWAVRFELWFQRTAMNRFLHCGEPVRGFGGGGHRCARRCLAESLSYLCNKKKSWSWAPSFSSSSMAYAYGCWQRSNKPRCSKFVTPVSLIGLRAASDDASAQKNKKKETRPGVRKWLPWSSVRLPLLWLIWSTKGTITWEQRQTSTCEKVTLLT